jgi:aspartyl-tRNA(Asn)/glutamyl-tRNA(Gln) amidotransferase subunit A
MTHLSQLGIGELRAALDKRETSSVEITKALLESIEAKKGLNTFAEVSVDLALGQAKTADEKLARGEKTPLLGVPIALKDNILAVGTKTTCGSKILNNFVSPYDATVTAKLKSNGAVILGKTNMDEFAMGSSNETSFLGTVKNPWDTSRVPGGSSGGSAAATLAGLAPGALGTDTGGSVRQPASLCGVYGLKPTYGRVSRYGIVAFASSLDQVGTFARSASDLATLTEVISGHDPLDSTSVSQPLPSCTAALTKGVKGLRIGVPKEYFIKGLDAEVESAVRTAVKEIEKLGATVVPVSLPHTEHSLAVYYVLAPAEASSNLARFDGIRYGYRVPDAKDLKDLYYRSRSEGFGKEVKRRIMVGAFVLSTGYYDAYYLRAQKVRTLVARDFTNAFTQCDVIASPVAPTTAFKIGEKTNDPIAMYLSDVFTIPVNLAGLPGMSIPCGMDSKGLPVGLQLIGKPWDEETLFRVAGAYEAATDWHKKRPQA